MNNNNNDFDEVADLRRKNKELNDQMIDLAIQLRNERQRNRDLLMANVRICETIEQFA